MGMKVFRLQARAMAIEEALSAIDQLVSKIKKLERAETFVRIPDGDVDYSRVQTLREWVRSEQRLLFEEWEKVEDER